ncbi:Dynamin-related GTPase protein [Marasmius crinis-equi]|uniref:Dynamin-related GTPase protein n=1 Tax=Marasmius crinis-equi TaxID=585013 RepID=A0ABR3F563_9AGAR
MLIVPSFSPRQPLVKPEQSSSSSTSTSTVASTSTTTSTITTATARVPGITRPTSDDSADDTDSGVSGIFPPRDARTSRAFIGTTNPRSIFRSPQPPIASLGVGAPSGTSPRETFLNYFFGAGVKEKKALGGGEMSMGMPSSGAFDMKSLAKAVDAPPTSTSSLPPPSTSTRTDLETTLIHSLVSSYLSLVREAIQDLVPKAVMHLLVNFTSSAVQNRLVAELYKPEMFEGMLGEDEGVMAERERVRGFWRRIGKQEESWEKLGLGKGFEWVG